MLHTSRQMTLTTKYPLEYIKGNYAFWHKYGHSAHELMLQKFCGYLHMRKHSQEELSGLTPPD